jgi:hypothetical protein
LFTPNKRIAGAPGAVPAGSRVYVWEIASGNMHQVDVGDNGQFTLIIPFPEDASAAYFLLSYATAPSSAGRIFSPEIKLGVDR